MTRSLTTEERTKLGSIVEDPDAWWKHATEVFKNDEEKALADKLAAPKHAAKIADEFTRVERDQNLEDHRAARIAENREARTYDEKRKEAYGSWESQMEMQADDKKDDTDTWGDHIAAVKAAHPKA